MAMVRPTALGTLRHARRSATIRSVPTAARTTSFVYMRSVCMRASSVPRCSLKGVGECATCNHCRQQNRYCAVRCTGVGCAEPRCDERWSLTWHGQKSPSALSEREGATRPVREGATGPAFPRLATSQGDKRNWHEKGIV
eukprot:248231-Pleurochrysis_carterae.AAC.1